MYDINKLYKGNYSPLTEEDLSKLNGRPVFRVCKGCGSRWVIVDVPGNYPDRFIHVSYVSNGQACRCDVNPHDNFVEYYPAEPIEEDC